MPAKQQQQQQPNFAGMFRGGLDRAQERLATLEREGQRAVVELRVRSKASRRELAALLARLGPGELLDLRMVRAWQKQARKAGIDLAQRAVELRSQAIARAGFAGREQVDELAHEVDRLTRKVDRLLGGARKTVHARG